jgi:hypothetical protein
MRIWLERHTHGIGLADRRARDGHSNHGTHDDATSIRVSNTAALLESDREKGHRDAQDPKAEHRDESTLLNRLQFQGPDLADWQ